MKKQVKKYTRWRAGYDDGTKFVKLLDVKADDVEDARSKANATLKGDALATWRAMGEQVKPLKKRARGSRGPGSMRIGIYCPPLYREVNE